jgi:hypothetical protein
VVSSEWAEGIQPWSFNLDTSGSYPTRACCTSTPSGRSIAPGSKVFWRGIYRIMEDDAWTLPRRAGSHHQHQ